MPTIKTNNSLFIEQFLLTAQLPLSLTTIMAVSKPRNTGNTKIWWRKKQQVQSNLGKSGIVPSFYSPGGSNNFQLHV